MKRDKFVFNVYFPSTTFTWFHIQNQKLNKMWNEQTKNFEYFVELKIDVSWVWMIAEKANE